MLAKIVGAIFPGSSYGQQNKKQKTEEAGEKPYPHPFQSGDYGIGAEPRTLVELSMMALSGSIRSKPGWHTKMNDSNITEKWRKEAIEQGVTEAMVDYVLAELDYYRSLRDGPIEPSPVDGVWLADGVVSDKLKQDLVDGVKALENVPDHLKDWHPGSNNQVLDLVHPSLFCLVTDHTLKTANECVPCLPAMGSGAIIPRPDDSKKKKPTWGSNFNYTKSDKFQWLPSEFDVDASGKVKIRSYINNLHPITHKGLYKTIASVFEKFVPLFAKTLADLRAPRPTRVTVDPYGWYGEEPNFDGSDEDERRDEWYETRTPSLPVPGAFEMPAAPGKVSLNGKRLQVIVKLANIQLTPENPSYPGGAWHVEGMENEHIVASGIYYYVSENISESILKFRAAVCEPDYEQSDDRGVSAVYGLHNEEALNQVIGQVITKEGRCVAFPNVFQHQVQPFKLEDPAKPGFRKILVFFLVDPAHRITSTLHVPPQQSDWFGGILKREVPAFRRLPEEIVDQIASYAQWPMGLDDAKKYREELMAERKFFISGHNQNVFERPFSLCEH